MFSSAVMTPLEVGVNVPVVLGQAASPCSFGGGDELDGLVALAAVDVEELRSGLEIGAGQAGVGMAASLLGWASAVAVGQAGGQTGEVVFDPPGVGGGMDEPVTATSRPPSCPKPDG
jgi:hypothetical protein